MTDKVLTAATSGAASDLRTAIFKQWRSDQLTARGAVAIDVDRRGRALVPQVTTAYVSYPRFHPANPAAPTAQELSDYAAAKLVQVPVDAVVEAMQGRSVDIGGKVVVIDVSAATAPAKAANVGK